MTVQKCQLVVEKALGNISYKLPLCINPVDRAISFEVMKSSSNALEC